MNGLYHFPSQRFLPFLAIVIYALSACSLSSPSSVTNNSYFEEDRLEREFSDLTNSGSEINTVARNENSVYGVLLVGSLREPAGKVQIFLGEVLISSEGVPAMISLDKANAPKTRTDDLGQFVFENVPPGNYGLIIDVITHSVLLKYPDSGEDLLIEMQEGDDVNLGELYYSSLPIVPLP